MASLVSSSTHFHMTPDSRCDLIPSHFKLDPTVAEFNASKVALTESNTHVAARATYDNMTAFFCDYLENTHLFAMLKNKNNVVDPATEAPYQTSYEDCLKKVIKYKKEIPFTFYAHFTDFKLRTYKGVDTKNPDEVVSAIYAIHRAEEVATKPEQKVRARQELDAAVKFATDHIPTLVGKQINGTTLTSSMAKQWVDRIKAAKTDDPWVELFKSNPALFDHIPEATREALKNDRPYIENASAFVAKFPTAQQVTVDCTTTFDLQKIQAAAEKFKACSVAKFFVLFSKSELLAEAVRPGPNNSIFTTKTTPEAKETIKILKNILLEKPGASIAFCNQLDRDTLAAEIIRDHSIINGVEMITGHSAQDKPRLYTLSSNSTKPLMRR